MDDTFSASVVLDPDIKKLIKNMQRPEFHLKMIVEHRTPQELTRTVIKSAISNQHDLVYVYNQLKFT